MRAIEAGGIVVAAVCAGLFQAAFSTFLPMPWAAFQPAILIIVFLTLRGGLQKAMLFGVVCGFVIDAFTPGVVGFALFRFIFVALMLSAFATGLLTNRSLFASLALNASAHIADAILGICFVFFASLVMKDVRFVFPSVVNMTMTFAWDTGVIILAYLARLAFAKRFVLFSSSKRQRYG
jgi:cell shape-determining protein MreD